MPIYEFKCKECGNIFETIVPSSDGVEDVYCTKCGSYHVKKEMSTFSRGLSSGSDKPAGGAFTGCSSKSGFS